MPSKPKSHKSTPPRIGKILETLGQESAQLPPHRRFSAAGSHFGAEVAGAETEPILDKVARGNIQGNIIPGFNKDYQRFLFFRLGKTGPTKKWLKWIAPRISTMDEVLAFNRMFRAMRSRIAAKDVPIKATWVNIAFSCSAIAALTSKKDCDAFGEQSFRQGLAARSEYLGDPSKPTAAGNKNKWVVGGPKNEADILVIVASDDPRDLSATVNLIKAKALECGLNLLFEQPGETLPGALRGHEHFGFKDGISQPAVRGTTSSSPETYITPRYIDPSDPRARLFAKPGQPLIWPGEFLLGERRQDPDDLYRSASPADNFPKWAARGSFLVCRRLRQDVQAFYQFTASAAATVGMPAAKVASMLVGRWPSGAPVMRTPGADDPAMAADDLVNNHFLFDDDTRASTLISMPGYPGDHFPQARADLLGQVCPHFAHIRKANPRDSATDLGKAADTLTRMILRRGIPFGPAVAGVKNPPASLWKKERGLVFISYQTSIEDQFEFLTRRWANSPIQPNVGGHDLIIGQRDSQGSRERFIDFPKGAKTIRIPVKGEWVIPTGGGYFFAPPIEAINDRLGA